MRMLRALAVVALLVLGSSACGSDEESSSDTTADTTTSTTAGSGGSSIVAEDLAFAPATLTVSVGTEVTVENKDGVSHTWTADGDAFDEALAGGASATHTFDEAGTFAYHCEIHSSMTGTVVVE
jgi:plastocyanin